MTRVTLTLNAGQPALIQRRTVFSETWNQSDTSATVSIDLPLSDPLGSTGVDERVVCGEVIFVGAGVLENSKLASLGPLSLISDLVPVA